MRGALALVACAYGLGLWLGDAGLAAAPVWLALGACAGLASLALARRAPLGFAFACAALLAAGAARMAARVEAGRSDPSPPAEAVLEGRVGARVPVGAGARVRLDEVVWAIPQRAGGARVSLRFERASEAPPLAARVRLAVHCGVPQSGSANPGGADALRARWREAVAVQARPIDPRLLEIIEGEPSNPWISLEDARERAIRFLLSFGRGGALLAALGLGAATGLPDADRAAWAQLGIAHILSVSGLHLALAAAAAFALARALLRRWAALAARVDTRRLALASAALAAALYAALAGLPAPTQRALAMLGALALATARARAAAAGNVLALAALLVLALDPTSLWSPSAQLSFAATGALVAGVSTRTERASSGLARALASLLSASALATVGSAPIAALHFGAGPPLAGLANVIAVPVTGFVGMPIAFAACAGALLAPHAIPRALFAAAAGLAERGLDAVLALGGALPPTPPLPPGPLALAFCAGCAGLACAARSLALRLACAFASQLALALLPPPGVAPELPRVVFLDVGHGDAALLQTREAAVLVDAGAAKPGGWDAGARVVVPALAALGVRRIDVLALSHADLDHRGGAASVLGAFPVGELWLPRGSAGDPAFGPLRTRARERAVPVFERGAGDPTLRRGALELAALWPPRRAADLGDNDRSLVLRATVGARSVLLAGDLEAAGEAALLASGAALRAEILKLAHHGSRSSSSAAFLAAVQPALAIASAPGAGRFGWPHAEVRERLAERGAELAWTGRDGAVLVALGPSACVLRWRSRALCTAFRRE